MKIIRLTTLLDFGGQEKKYISFTHDKSLLQNDYFFAAIGHGGHAENVLKNKGCNVTIFNKNPKISCCRSQFSRNNCSQTSRCKSNYS
jgi:hypothetical protein